MCSYSVHVFQFCTYLMFSWLVISCYLVSVLYWLTTHSWDWLYLIPKYSVFTGTPSRKSLCLVPKYSVFTGTPSRKSLCLVPKYSVFTGTPSRKSLCLVPKYSVFTGTPSRKSFTGTPSRKSLCYHRPFTPSIHVYLSTKSKDLVICTSIMLE